MYLESEWKDEGRPGYLGARRDETMRGWDEKFGKGNWTLGWKINSVCFTDYLGACAIYEDSYFRFMTAMRPEITCELIARASNVYDVEPSDIQSGLNYLIQQHGRTHVQDISLRRVLVRCGIWFAGPEPIQIRFHNRGDRLSQILTPGRVPFHLPQLLEPPFTEPHDKWYDALSVEAFYQFNKHLLVRK